MRFSTAASTSAPTSSTRGAATPATTFVRGQRGREPDFPAGVRETDRFFEVKDERATTPGARAESG